MTTSRTLILLAAGLVPLLAADTPPAPVAGPAPAESSWASLTKVLEGMEYHGFMSQGYMVSKDNNYLAGETTSGGSLDMREVGMNASVQATDRLRIGAQIYGRTLGDLESVEVDWAYADYRLADQLGFRAGLVKLPRGLYNELQDLDLATSTVLLPQAVYDLRLRDFQVAAHGAQMYGTIPAAGAGSFDYSIYAGGRHMEADGSVSKFWKNGLRFLGFQTDRVGLDWLAGGQVMWNVPIDGLKLGASYIAYGDMVADGTINGAPLGLPPGRISCVGTLEGLTSWIVSAEYTINDWRFASEYTIWDSDVKTEFITGIPGLGTITQTDVYQPEGFYLQGAWQATDRIELSGTGSFYFADKDHHGTSNPRAYQYDYYVGAKYGITDNWIVKGELHYIRGTALYFADDNPEGLEDTDVLFAAKTTISF